MINFGNLFLAILDDMGLGHNLNLVCILNSASLTMNWPYYVKILKVFEWRCFGEP